MDDFFSRFRALPSIGHGKVVEKISENIGGKLCYRVAWLITLCAFKMHSANFILIMEVSHPYGFYGGGAASRYGFSVLHSSKFRGSPEGRHAGIRARIVVPAVDAETLRTAPHEDEAAKSRPSDCPCPIHCKCLLACI